MNDRAQIDPDWRRSAIQELTAEDLDVLVVGGGIVGAGIARDSAMRGLRTGLVEQHDFASGTSSRSAGMLHGGLRYLAQGNIGLVRQASLEKLVIRRIAPHLADPLPFIFPSYRKTPWPRWKLRIGVKLYDLLCNRHNFDRSEMLTPRQIESRLPGIRLAGLNGGVRYFDGLTRDARLVLDTLRSAGRHRAALLNYARLQAAQRTESRWHCRIRDIFGDRSILIKSRCVVNASGPWAMQLPLCRVKVRGTKGVHLVVRRSRFPIPEAVMMTAGKRVIWAIPWGERVYIGTTDTDFSGRPETAATRARGHRLPSQGGRFPFSPAEAAAGGYRRHLGRRPPSGGLQRRASFRGLAFPQDRDGRRRLAGRRRRKVDHPSSDGGGGRQSIGAAFESGPAALPDPQRAAAGRGRARRLQRGDAAAGIGRNGPAFL